MQEQQRPLARIKSVARSLVSVSTRPELVRRAIRRLARARVIPRSVWRHLPAARIVEFDVAGRRIRCELPDTDGVARELDWIGVRGEEAATIQVIAKLAASSEATVDVGANVGLYTTIAATCSDGPVWAFEPVPRTFEILEKNVERNDLGDQVQVARRAVGRDKGRTSFHVPWGDCPSSASLSATGYRGLEGELIEVDVVRLDDALDPDVPVGLVKIDVEGFEDAVIDGMSNLITRWSPSIVLESNHDGPYAEVEARLRSHGYQFAQLRPEGPRAVDSLRTGADERYRNFLCEPAST